MNKFKYLASALLILAVFHLPYGYYTILRIIITIIAGVCAYEELERSNKTFFALFSGIAILFNPLIPVYLSKSIWIPIDLAVALFFVLSASEKTVRENDLNEHS